MSWLSRLRGAVAGALAPVAETTAAAGQYAPSHVPDRRGFEAGIPRGGTTEWNTGGGANNTDRRTQLQQLYESYLACPPASACVDTIARTITGGGVELVWDDDTGQPGEEAPPDTPDVVALRRLLRFTNPTQDIRQLMRRVITDLLVYGDAYIEVSWFLGQPVALYPLHVPTIAPIADEHGVVTKYVQVMETGARAEFQPDEIIHIPLDDSSSGIIGVSPTQKAILPIVTWLFTAATIKERMRKGDPPQVAVDFPTTTSENDVRIWGSKYLQSNVGSRNIGTPVMTRGVSTVHELQVGSLEKQLLAKSAARDEILQTYGVPPAKVSVIESGNIGGGTGEAQDKSFRVNTCAPIAETVLEKFNYLLVRLGFGLNGWMLRFGDIDWRDSKVVEEIRDLRLKNGSWTVNRYRADVGEPPVEGGDEPILVDRAQLVLWRDMAAMSQASVAQKAKGTDLAVKEPGAGEPLELVQADEPEPVPQQLLPAAAGAVPAPPGDEEPPAKENVLQRDQRRLTESWQISYRHRRRQALRELPELTGSRR